ncbi:DEAD/DEAH box helicase, partial [Planctomycetota bacterium]
MTERPPLRILEDTRDNLIRYIQTAFKTCYPSLETERELLLREGDTLFQTPYIEPILEYGQGKQLNQLNKQDLPGFTTDETNAFISFCDSGLFGSTWSLYKHQQQMLLKALSGKHCVVTTGTGSGKTESFLFPLVAKLVQESLGWQKSSTPHKWDWWNHSRTSPINRRHNENRPAAMRALILYPMNALVDDQMSRLREAFDSLAAHRWYDSYSSHNRFYFGRYNGQTPVAGHTIKQSNDKLIANSSKRQELKTKLVELQRASDQLDSRIEQVTQQMGNIGEDPRHSDLQSELEELSELRTFFPRVTAEAAEMISRWDMQDTPPDILVTNSSMLSIMLMRHSLSNSQEDTSDAEIFDTTRKWLSQDKSNVFHLIVDEIHLYRGSAGTEVAYLLRLLLDRLGLNPDSPQLRILGSSASIDNPEEGEEFLCQFFGLEEARKKLEIIQGNIKVPPVDTNELPFEPFYALGSISNIASSHLAQLCNSIGIPADEPSMSIGHYFTEHSSTLLNACISTHSEIPKAINLMDFARNIWSHDARDDSSLLIASQGLLTALEQVPHDTQSFQSIPRFRVHLLARNVDGLWASTSLNSLKCGQQEEAEKEGRYAGKLYSSDSLFRDHNGDRILEVLYCECCGTIFFGGYRIPFHDAAGGILGWELVSNNPELEDIPSEQEELFHSNRLLSKYMLFWPSHRSTSPQSPQWKQASLKAIHNRQHESTYTYFKKSDLHQASWIPGQLSPSTGQVIPYQLDLDESPPGSGTIHGYYYQIDPSQESNVPSLPHICPACDINYSKRQYRLSPIRAFRTGLNKLLQVLSLNFMEGL